MSLLNGALLGSGGAGMIAGAATSEPLAFSISAVGFLTGALLEADQRNEAHSRNQTQELLHGWVQREAERPRDGMARS